jgi:DNA polymerase (family X)
MKKTLIAIKKGLKRNKKKIASRTKAASGHLLPQPLENDHIMGGLNAHSDWTDGNASVEKMADDARMAGRRYQAICDHARQLAFIGGLDVKRLAAQGREIDTLNGRYSRQGDPFQLLKGAEVDIHGSGRLELPDEVLSRLDIVAVAVHSGFKLPRTEQTARIIAALRNPNADILVHPKSRYIYRRDPIDVDMVAILKEAKRTGTAVDIGAFPDRRDLRIACVRMAAGIGVKLAVDTDAHAASRSKYAESGAGIARRGRAVKKDILNALPLEKLLLWLRTPKGKRK